MPNNKDIKFLNVTISGFDVDDLEARAIMTVQQRANSIFAQRSDSTVALAWIEATLEYLYNAKLLSTEFQTYSELKRAGKLPNER